MMVLIESDWNLKPIPDKSASAIFCVLIESDWNLKRNAAGSGRWMVSVLIESDWNLKDMIVIIGVSGAIGINRIRLEFKVN